MERAATPRECQGLGGSESVFHSGKIGTDEPGGDRGSGEPGASGGDGSGLTGGGDGSGLTGSDHGNGGGHIVLLHTSRLS